MSTSPSLVTGTAPGEDPVAGNGRQPLGCQGGLPPTALRERGSQSQGRGKQTRQQPAGGWGRVLPVVRPPGESAAWRCVPAARGDAVQRPRPGRAWTPDPQKLWASVCGLEPLRLWPYVTPPEKTHTQSIYVDFCKMCLTTEFWCWGRPQSDPFTLQTSDWEAEMGTVTKQISDRVENPESCLLGNSFCQNSLTEK